MLWLFQPQGSKYGDERISALSVIDWAGSEAGKDRNMRQRVTGHTIRRDIDEATDVRWHDAIALTDDMPREQFELFAARYAGSQIPLLVITDALDKLPEYAQGFTPVPYKPV